MNDKKNCGCNKNGDKKECSSKKKQGSDEIRSDVQGSYTGTPTQGTQPVQDADDL